MKIQVTKKDIDEGRGNVGFTCGCPIWRAINRQLKLNLPIGFHTLAVPKMSEARLGRLSIKLPKQAIEMQQILRAAPNAHVEPLEFEAELKLV